MLCWVYLFGVFCCDSLGRSVQVQVFRLCLPGVGDQMCSRVGMRCQFRIDLGGYIPAWTRLLWEPMFRWGPGYTAQEGNEGETVFSGVGKFRFHT